jgi:thiamine biosynthesis lipoprotein
MKLSKTVYKRCRPLLGTFVEITALNCEQEVSKAFAAIEEVSTLMSFHDPQSQLSKLNRTPVGKWITVHKKLIKVLSLALDLHKKSDGVFNVTVGGSLKYLNKTGFEIRSLKVRRLLPIKIDLSGIAKGYAVDQAVKVLSKIKNSSGCVNAGGDLRVFGKKSQTVNIRTQNGYHCTSVLNQALATSEIIPNSHFSYYVDTKNKITLTKRKAAVVVAPQCVLADALTKVALMSSLKRAEKIVSGYGGQLKVL